jgi:outer membrane protein TolC
MLFITLGKARMALIALISIPLGLMGGIIAVNCTSSVVSVSSLIGFVTVAGFTIRNGILLLNSYQEQMSKGLTPREAIIEGSLERMVPILMTSLTTILGLIPIMYAADTPGGELLAPLAIVQFGGILGAMLLGLIVLPAVTILVCGKSLKTKTFAPVFFVFITLPFILGGCKTYKPEPIDWEEEVSSWENAKTTLTLTSCEDAALLACIGNPDLNILRVASLGSQKVAAEVGWWEDPSLDLDVKRILKSSENPFVVGTTISFSIPLSGALALDARAAEEVATADRVQVQCAELDIATDARIAFHNYTLALARVRLLTSHLEDTYYNHTLQTLKELVAQGEISIATGADIQRTHINRKNELKRAEQEVETTREVLRRCLGLAPWVMFNVLPDTTLDTCPHCQTNVPAPLEMVNHLKVKEQLLRLNASETALQAEIRRQYPELKIGPAYEYEDGHNLLGLTLGIDLPLWNRNREAIAKAEASRDTTRITAIQTWRTLLLDATSTHAQLSAALKALPEQPTFNHETLKQLTQQGEFSIDEYFTYYDSLLDNQLECLEAQAFIITTRAELSRFQIIEE